VKPLLLIFFSLLFSFCFAQQTEQTFIVKKRAFENKKEFPKIFDLKLAPGVDTICGGIMLDLSPAKGYYDSVFLFNLQMRDYGFGGDKYFFDTTNRNGHAIITFYKKEKDGSYKMVYFRNWVIHCLDKYSK